MDSHRQQWGIREVSKMESWTDLATAKAVRTLRLRSVQRISGRWAERRPERSRRVETSASRVHFERISGRWAERRPERSRRVETSASRVHFDGVDPLALRLRERINAAVGLCGPNRLGDCYKYAVLTPELEATYRYAMLCERDFF